MVTYFLGASLDVLLDFLNYSVGVLPEFSDRRPAMANLHNHERELGIVNGVEDSIVPLAKTILFLP